MSPRQDFGGVEHMFFSSLEAKMYKKAAGKKFQQALFHGTFISNSF